MRAATKLQTATGASLGNQTFVCNNLRNKSQLTLTDIEVQRL